MSTPSRPPASPQWKRVEARPPAELARTPEPPERRADSALQAVLTKAKPSTVPPVSVRRDEREAERRRAKRRRRAIVWGRRGGYVIAAAIAVWLVLLSPLFALDPAKVQATGYGTVVDPDAVKAVVADQAGTSLAMLSTGRMASALKDIPGVREAHVERSWPDGLVITLVSREPVAAVPSPTGGYELVDNEGTQVGRASKPPTGLPTLHVPSNDEKVLTAALDVVNSLPAELKARVTTISAATEDSVSFKLSKGPRVEWGSAESSELKVKVLTAMLAAKEPSKADVIDVSAPTLPITKDN